MNDKLKVNKETYAELIRQDIEFLDKYFTDGLETDHIKHILKYSIELIYGEPKQEEYKKYEFCKDVGCRKCFIDPKDNSDFCIIQEPKLCVETAKTFHKWLKENNYEIIRRQE